MSKNIKLGVVSIVLGIISCCRTNGGPNQTIPGEHTKEKCVVVYDSIWKREVFNKVDIPSDFNMGIDSLNTSLLKGVNLYEHELSKKIVLIMIVDTAGNIACAYIHGKGYKEYLDHEKRIVANAYKLSKSWTSAKCDKDKVPYQIMWTVNF